MIPLIIGLIIGGSLGFLACAMFVVNKADNEDKKSKYIK